MGADGGVAALRIVGSEEKVRKLLQPWLGYIAHLSGHSSWGDDSRWNWIQDHGAPAGLLGAYGTDCDDYLQLPYLEDFLYDLEEALTCEARGVGPDATFADLFLERKTRTRDLGWLESARYRAWLDEISDSPEFLSQKIKPWIEELRQEITGRPDGCIDVYTEETWT